MCGWIKIHRDIVNHWIYQDAVKFQWWIDLIMMASWEESKVLVGNQLVTLQRGQLIGSYASLAKKWGVSKDKVMAFLGLLQRDSMIHKATQHNVSIVTICNYESYQDNDSEQSNTFANTFANTQPHTLPTQIKEVKEINNNNNISTTRTRETVRDYAARYVSEGIWIPMACQKTHRKKEVVLAWLDEFVMMLEHNEEQKADFKDFKDHFWNHIGRRAELERQAERKTGDGSDKRQQDTDRRRGVPAVARTREEYQKPF